MNLSAVKPILSQLFSTRHSRKITGSQKLWNSLKTFAQQFQLAPALLRRHSRKITGSQKLWNSLKTFAQQFQLAPALLRLCSVVSVGTSPLHPRDTRHPREGGDPPHICNWIPDQVRNDFFQVRNNILQVWNDILYVILAKARISLVCNWIPDQVRNDIFQIRNDIFQIRNDIKKKKGFSLLEILIAVAIFASSLLFILPSIKKSENETKKTLRTLQALNRTLYSYSRIRNKVYRLALKTHLQKSSYWVEVKTPLAETLVQPDTESSDTFEEPVSIEESPFFQQDTQILNTQELPDGLYFEWIDNNIESDIIYITYDPHLLTHQIQIFLRKGSDFTWTLSFNPIVGELEILEGENES